METHNEATLNIVESHKNAALHHQEAAKSHLDAAKFHAGGEEIQANESAKTAILQSEQAIECEKEVKQHHKF